LYQDYLFVIHVLQDTAFCEKKRRVYSASLDRPVSAIAASLKHGKVVGVSYEHESTLWVWELEEGLFEK